MDSFSNFWLILLVSFLLGGLHWVIGWLESMWGERSYTIKQLLLESGFYSLGALVLLNLIHFLSPRLTSVNF